MPGSGSLDFDASFEDLKVSVCFGAFDPQDLRPQLRVKVEIVWAVLEQAFFLPTKTDSLLLPVETIPNIVHCLVHGRQENFNESSFILDFTFETKELREVCENAGAAKQQFGEMTSSHLRSTLADLTAADTLEEFSTLFGISVSEGDGVFCCDLTGGVTLSAKPGHKVLPTTDDGNIDLREVRRVKILSLGKV